MNAVTLIAGAVLNSLWQAVLLAFLVWLAIKLVGPHVNAATRHLIWWITLVAIAILPCIPRSAPTTQPGQPLRSEAVKAAVPIRVSAPLAPPPVQATVTVKEKRTTLWPFGVLGIWAAVCARQLIVILGSYFYLRALKQRAVPSSHALPRLTRPARLLLAFDLPSPVAVGFFHPAVVLPVGLPDQLTSAELQCVLLHESAHLARYDDWENVVARLVRAVTVPHPVAWWVLRQIDREREMACDDWVVAHIGAVQSYVESLARVLELQWSTADSVLASGLFEHHSRLRVRIETLLLRGRRFSTAAARIPIVATAVTLGLLAFTGALAPHWIAFAQRLEFDVASIKQNTANVPNDFTPRRSGTLVTMHNTQVGSVLYYAYHITGSYQLVGFDPNALPWEWTWIDVDARAPLNASDDQIRLMFQSLLEDRYKLRIHRETREIPEYELVDINAKLDPSHATDNPMPITVEGKALKIPSGKCSISGWLDGDRMICHAAPAERIVAEISSSLRSPVVDRTGLTQTYDVNLLFASENRKLPEDQTPAPSLEDAIRDLGLKLKKGKGPVEVIVVDHVEKPSGN
jgi:uncharacterized protein (TIGR03435 family)